MPDSKPDAFDAAAKAVADGKNVDWSALSAGGTLSREEVQALRIIQGLRCGGSPEATSEAQGPAPIPQGLEIGSQIGKGAHGRVFAATDRALDREVAVKVIGADRALSPDAKARCLREARLIASVDHPNVVRIYGIEESQGELRLTFEKIDGRTLTQLVREAGPLSAGEAAAIAVDLCRALAALHGKGIVHRDLKPDNVMRASGGRIVLLDLGIASASDDPSSATPSDGAGTPMFMAPEQFASPGGADARSDLFALGALLYWMVSGHYPFAAATLKALRERLLSGESSPLTDHRPDVPAAFAAIVAKALARRREDRFQSAGELEQELRRFGGEHVGPPLPRPRRLRRHIVGVLAALVVISAAVWLAVMPTRAGQDYAIEAHLWRIVNGVDEPLDSGHVIHPGDKLVLKTLASVPLHIYVLNEDGNGAMRSIFPFPGGDWQNPLPAGSHRLPGPRGGEPQVWPITNLGGGTEYFLVVASPTPIPEMVDLASSLPSVRIGEADRNREVVLRGVELVEPAPPTDNLQGSANANEQRLAALYDQFETHPLRTRGKTAFFIRLRTAAQ